MRLGELERLIFRKFEEAGVDSPGLCARLLLAKALGKRREDLIGLWNFEPPPEILENIKGLCLRRIAGEPLAYILGIKEFYGRDFFVTPAVLIPRPETELLVDLALRLPLAEAAICADLGCGSGCLGLTLALEKPSLTCLLVDKDASALEIALINNTALKAGATLIQGDLFSPAFLAGSCDLVASNPPYIGIKDEIMPEVVQFEPQAALFSCDNGKSHLAGVAAGAWHLLKSGGWLIMEHGAFQKSFVLALLASCGYEEIADFEDLAGLPRCVRARKKAK